MTQAIKLETGNEYYFYGEHYFWSGFFMAITDGLIHIKRGHMYFTNNEVYAYGEAFLDLSQIIGIAST